MQIRFHCPNDHCVAIIEYEPLEDCGGSIKCPRCDQQHQITVTDSMRNDNRVDRCAACGCAELFVRKDFPQRLGLLIVVVFGAIAIYFFTVSVLIALTILSAAFLLDVVIYLLLGKVTGCYACRAEYRKCILDPAHKDFDLAARGH